MLPADQSSRPLPPEGGKGRGRKSSRGGSAPKTRKDSKVLLIFALILGIFATLLIIGSGGEKTSGGTQTYVVRAVRDITAWTEIQPGDVEAVPVDLSTLFPEDSFRDPSEELFIAATPEAAVESMRLGDGIYTRNPVRIGQLLYKADLAQGSLVNQTLDGINVEPGDRIISVEAMPAAAAGGAIRPGDRVDVIVADTSYGLAKILVADIPVLYVNVSSSALESIYSNQIQEPDRGLNEMQPSDPLPGIYTLAVPAAHAEEVALFAARNQATLILALRHNSIDDEDRPVLDENGRQPLTRTVSVLDVLCPGELLPVDSDPAGSAIPPAGEVEETPTIELPEACVKAIVELRNDIANAGEPVYGGGATVPVTGGNQALPGTEE